MGSCLSMESRSPIPNSPTSAVGLGKKGSKKGSRCQKSLDHRREERLHRIPGRMFLNGSSEVAALFTQQGKKGINQDAMLVWEDFASRKDAIFCGVFDGHGPFGHMIAKRVRDSLPLKLSAHWEAILKCNDVLREINLNVTGSMNSEETPFMSADEESRASVDVEETEKYPDVFYTLKESFLKSFKVMDRELRLQKKLDCICSGTTAVTLVKQGQHIVIGNVGDSRAVLGTRDKDNSLIAVQLTVDLKPNVPEEAERIHKYKGRVFALQDEPDVARVWLPNCDSPGLAMARAFGDFCLKGFGLISVPDISYRRLTENDEFVVLATDGIWDVLSNEEVVEIVASAPTRSSAARALVESAVRAWRFKYPTSKVDDCAVVCLFLDSKAENACIASFAKSKELAAPMEQGDTVSVEQDPSRPYETNNSRNASSGEEMMPHGAESTADDRSKEEASTDEELHAEAVIDWSALEGVSRVNTLVNLPRFVPCKDMKSAGGSSKTRK